MRPGAIPSHGASAVFLVAPGGSKHVDKRLILYLTLLTLAESDETQALISIDFCVQESSFSLDEQRTLLQMVSHNIKQINSKGRLKCNIV